MSAAPLIVVILAVAAPHVLLQHLLGRVPLLPATAAAVVVRFRRGEDVQPRMGDFATRRLTVVEKLHLEAVILLGVALEPSRGDLGGVQLQPTGVLGRVRLRNPIPQEKTPRHRRAEVDQDLQFARTSVIALQEESQGRVVNRDVVLCLFGRNRDGEVQGVTVIPSPAVIVVVGGKIRSIPRTFCNEKRAPVNAVASYVNKLVNGSRKIRVIVIPSKRMTSTNL